MPKRPMKGCLHSKHINCDQSAPCEHCGWNPAEFERRRTALGALDFETPSETLKHLIIKKEETTVGNPDINPDSCATATEG